MNTPERVTTCICLTVFFIAAWCAILAKQFLDSDRELVIRHVIDLTPIVKSK